jgi:hypothetical protein
MADRWQPLRSAHYHQKLVQQAAVGRLHLCRILLTSWFGRAQGGSGQLGGQFYVRRGCPLTSCRNWSSVGCSGAGCSALAAPAVWAEEEEDSAIGLYGCTKPITSVAVGGLHSRWQASRLPVLSSKAWPSGPISSLCASNINTQNGESYICQKKFPRKILILELKLHQAISPARNRLTRRAKQLRARGR